jgi:hypothetical protein
MPSISRSDTTPTIVSHGSVVLGRIRRIWPHRVDAWKMDPAKEALTIATGWLVATSAVENSRLDERAGSGRSRSSRGDDALARARIVLRLGVGLSFYLHRNGAVPGCRQTVGQRGGFDAGDGVQLGQ